MRSGRWLRTDTVDNAIDCVEMAAHVLDTVDSGMKWKWVIIAVHQALYGFAIDCVWGTESSSILRKPEDPESHVISVWEALRRAQDASWMTRPGSKPLVMTDMEAEQVRRLCECYRNEFEHFGVKRWSIELSGIQKLIEAVVCVVRKLAIDCNAVNYRSVERKERAVGALDRLSRRLEELSA